jgi:hypothetical protein
MTLNSDAILAHALGELAERCLEQEPACTICEWDAAVAAWVFLADSHGNGVRRGAVLPLCMVCMVGEHIQARVQEALTRGQRRERAPWN